MHKDVRLWSNLEPTLREVLAETKVASRARDLYACARLSPEVQRDLLGTWDRVDVAAFHCLVVAWQAPKKASPGSRKVVAIEALVDRVLEPATRSQLITLLTGQRPQLKVRDDIVSILVKGGQNKRRALTAVRSVAPPSQAAAQLTHEPEPNATSPELRSDALRDEKREPALQLVAEP
ncbi:MAG: hypothetical protein ACHREM_20760 [Polyangiales bacterium]